jgi:hypothetical protein
MWLGLLLRSCIRFVHDLHSVYCAIIILSFLLAHCVCCPSESVEFTEFEPYHFRRVRLAGGITDILYSK